MFSIWVAGHWLSNLAPRGPVTMEYGEHGFDSASWLMPEGFRHPALRGNAPVDIYDGGFNIGRGRLIEPDAGGGYAVRGLWRQAEDTWSLNSFGDMTSWPQESVSEGIARGELTWAGGATNFPLAAWGNPSEPMTVAAVLNGYTAEQSTRWALNGNGVVSHQADATTPHWMVPHSVAGRGLTPADDEFFSHLIGRYRDSTGLYRSVTVGSANAATVFGRRTKLVDLSDLGNQANTTKATAVLQGMLLKSGARMGFAEGLELAHGQITTLGGTPAALSQITSLQTVRLAGVVDTSRPYLMRGSTDIVLKTVRYTEGSRTITLTPFGYAPRSYEDVLDEAMAATR